MDEKLHLSSCRVALYSPHRFERSIKLSQMCNRHSSFTLPDLRSRWHSHATTPHLPSLAWTHLYVCGAASRSPQHHIPLPPSYVISRSAVLPVGHRNTASHSLRSAHIISMCEGQQVEQSRGIGGTKAIMAVPRLYIVCGHTGRRLGADG